MLKYLIGKTIFFTSLSPKNYLIQSRGIHVTCVHNQATFFHFQVMKITARQSVISEFLILFVNLNSILSIFVRMILFFVLLFIQIWLWNVKLLKCNFDILIFSFIKWYIFNRLQFIKGVEHSRKVEHVMYASGYVQWNIQNTEIRKFQAHSYSELQSWWCN